MEKKNAEGLPRYSEPKYEVVSPVETADATYYYTTYYYTYTYLI